MHLHFIIHAVYKFEVQPMLRSAITADKIGFVDTKSNSVPNCTEVSMAIQAMQAIATDELDKFKSFLSNTN